MTRPTVGWSMVVAVFLAAGCSGGSEPASPTTTSTTAPTSTTTTQPLELLDVDDLTSYRIEFDVVELERERTETIVVERPYRSRRTSEREGELTSGTIANDEGLWNYTSESQTWQLIDKGKRLAEGDDQLADSLALLEQQGLAERLDDDEVAGRTCTQFRVSAPVGMPALDEPSDTDYVDYCIDRTDVVLSEHWVGNGKPVRDRVATSFEPDFALPDEVFVADPPKDTTEVPGGSSQLELEYTPEIERQLLTSYRDFGGLESDGARATVTLSQGTPVDGTVLRYYRKGDALAVVEEVETSRVTQTDRRPYQSRVGKAFISTNLRQIRVDIEVDDSSTVVVRSPDLGLIDRLLDVMELRERDDAGN